MTDQSYPMPPGTPGYGGFGALEPAAAGPTWEPPKEPAKPRRPMLLFDRVKIFVILGLWLVFSLWRFRTDQPAYTFNDALIEVLRQQSWALVLGLIEVVRQIHYLISENNAGYNALWTDKVWGGIDRWKEKRNPWLRYRTARYAKFAAAYLIFAMFLAHSRQISLAAAVGAVPSSVYNFLTNGPDQVPFWVNLLFPMIFLVGQFGFLFWFLSRGGVDVYMPEDITTTFNDVWGQDHVLTKVKENVLFLEDPQAIEDRGGHVPGGILLWGPPGTGKTLMAEAVAGETGKPYVFVDPGAFINMFMGVGIIKVKSLFRKLRKLALKYGGVIVFFDEADSLGNRGSGVGAGGDFGMSRSDKQLGEHLRWLSPGSQGLWFEEQRLARAAAGADEPERRRIRDKVIVGGGMGGGGMGTLQALLSEISGLKKPRGFLNRTVRRFFGLRPKPPLKYRILVMMATNMPDALDDAMLRPGRIDRIYKVGYPTKEGRKRTYEGYLGKVRHQLTPEQIEKLAVITPYTTGAKVKDLINEALINAIRNGRDAVTWQDVIWAKHFKELGPPEDVEYIERERHAVAVHEACHAVAAYRVRRHMSIDLATIEMGSNYLGMVASIKPEDQFTNWRTEFEADIIVSLASLAGERLFFDDDNSSGVTGDLMQATFLAARMEALYGMGATVTSHLGAVALHSNLGPGHQIGLGAGRGPRPEEGKDEPAGPGPMGERVEQNLQRLLASARQLLLDNWFEVLSVAHALETYKTLAGEDVMAVIDGVQGPLIDGRVYATQQMRDELAAYHELAAAAHRHHGRVEAALPLARMPYPSHGGAVVEVPAYHTTGPVMTGPVDTVAPSVVSPYPQAGPPTAYPGVPGVGGAVPPPPYPAPAPHDGVAPMAPPTVQPLAPPSTVPPPVGAAEPPVADPYAPHNGATGSNGTNGHHDGADAEPGPDGANGGPPTAS